MRTIIQTHCNVCGSLIQRDLFKIDRVRVIEPDVEIEIICTACGHLNGRGLMTTPPPAKPEKKKDNYKAKVPVDNRIKKRRIVLPQDGTERKVIQDDAK